MATELYVNNYQTTLAAPLASGVASMTVTDPVPSGLAVAGGQFAVIIEGEIIEVPSSAGLTTSWTSVARAQENTSQPASHPAGAFVTHILTAASLLAIIQQNAPGGGGSAFGSTRATKTGAYTLTGSDEVIFADATAAAFALTLPTAVGFTSHYVLKAINTNSNLVTVQTTASQTIDGASTITLGAPASPAQYVDVILVSDGANWRVV